MNGAANLAQVAASMEAMLARLNGVVDAGGNVPGSALRGAQGKYLFFTDAAPGVTITVGDTQGPFYHSGPSDETAVRLSVDAKTAPGAAGLPITVQYGDTNDWDTVASWTTIATLTLSSQKSDYTETMTTATIPAHRLVRMNVGTIVGTPKDAQVQLDTQVPLT